jgi:hypothetical protein
MGTGKGLDVSKSSIPDVTWSTTGIGRSVKFCACWKVGTKRDILFLCLSTYIFF